MKVHLFVLVNSGKEVAKQTFQLHYNYCVKNIQKCPYCELPIAKSEMMDHLAQMKGSSEQAQAAAVEGDFEALQKMQQHGADILSFRDHENQDNCLLHFAVKSDNVQLLKFLRSLEDTDFDTKNANGETALHLCCGQQPKEELAKFLVMCGASISSKNALGDTPVTLATRFGNTELALLLTTSDQQ